MNSISMGTSNVEKTNSTKYRMDIIFSCDKNYVMPAGVMLCSLFENNQDAFIRVHGLYNGEGDVLAPLNKLVKKYGGEFCSYNMSNIKLPDLPVFMKNQRAHITTSAYYRLFVAEVLPDDIDKVLYLDCDIVVEGSIKELWEVNLEELPLGCVPDNENNNSGFSNRLGYDAKYGYFNSGVLLINLKYWREHNVKNNFELYIGEHYDNLILHDQDVLNHEFAGSKKELPIRFNLQTGFLWKDRLRHISCVYFDQIKEAFLQPCVIHFTEDKPWYSNSTHPMKDYWNKYQNLTEWKGHNWGRRKEKLKTKLIHIASMIIHRERSWGKYIYNREFI